MRLAKSGDNDDDEDEKLHQFYQKEMSKVYEMLELERIASSRAQLIISQNYSNNNKNPDETKSDRENKRNLSPSSSSPLLRDAFSQTETRFILQPASSSSPSTFVHHHFVEVRSAGNSAIGFESPESSTRTTESAEKVRRQEELEGLKAEVAASKEQHDEMKKQLAEMEWMNERLQERIVTIKDDHEKCKRDLVVAQTKNANKSARKIRQNDDGEQQNFDGDASATSNTRSGNLEEMQLRKQIQDMEAELSRANQDYADLFDKNLDLVDELHLLVAGTKSASHKDQTTPVALAHVPHSHKTAAAPTSGENHSDVDHNRYLIQLEQVTDQLDRAEERISAQEREKAQLEHTIHELYKRIAALEEDHDEAFEKNLNLIDEVVELRQQQQNSQQSFVVSPKKSCEVKTKNGDEHGRMYSPTEGDRI